MISLSGLKAASSNLAKLREFVETGALQQTIQEVGGIELQAAALALANMSAAKDPGREVAAAVVHLQSAHVAFAKLHAGSDYLSQEAFLSAAGKDVMTCCLLAVCYTYLDEPALTNNMLSAALAASRQLTVTAAVKRSVIHPVRTWKQGVGMVLSPIRSVKAHRYLDFEPAEVRAFARALTSWTQPNPRP